jgi:acid phosphatase
MRLYRVLLSLISASLCASCTTTPAPYDPQRDLGLLWVKHAAEYQAVSLQVYQAATRALAGFIDDRSWTVVPGNVDVRDLPPAVILDVDGTVINGADFQLAYERPFANWKLHEWSEDTVAVGVPGAADFVAAARDLGVTVFFVTNRPCQEIDGNPDPCPQKAATIQDIAEVGIETDAEHVMMSEEQGWNREKLTRRQLIAETHRVIMLVGDELGDFAPCARVKVHAPCTEPATIESRQRTLTENRELWGYGWYLLPNPMHGSWTSQL